MTNTLSVQGAGAANPRDPREPPASDGDAGLVFAPLLLEMMQPVRAAAPHSGGQPSADAADPAGSSRLIEADEQREPRRASAGAALGARFATQTVRSGGTSVAQAAAAELGTRSEMRLVTRQAMERGASDGIQDGDAPEESSATPEPGVEKSRGRRDEARPAFSTPHAIERALPVRAPENAAGAATYVSPRSISHAGAVHAAGAGRAMGAGNEGARAQAGTVKVAAAAGGGTPTGRSAPLVSAAGPQPGASRPMVAGVERASDSAARAPVRARTSAGTAPRSAPEADVAEQVQKGLAAVLQQRGGSVTIRLAPESLGAVRIRLDVVEGRVRAKFEAASDGARRLLESNLDGLRASLEARGLTVERLDIGPLNEGPQSRPQEAGTPDGAGGAGDGRAATEDPTRREAGDRAEHGTFASEPAEPGVGVGPVCVVTRLGLDAVA